MCDWGRGKRAVRGGEGRYKDMSSSKRPTAKKMLRRAKIAVGGKIYCWHGGVFSMRLSPFTRNFCVQLVD